MMTLISALHNFSRSLGLALLAASSGTLVLIFLGAEYAAYFAFKLARSDFHYWTRVDGIVGVVVSITTLLFERKCNGKTPLMEAISMTTKYLFEDIMRSH